MKNPNWSNVQSTDPYNNTGLLVFWQWMHAKKVERAQRRMIRILMKQAG